jgi:hypothetical protein
VHGSVKAGDLGAAHSGASAHPTLHRVRHHSAVSSPRYSTPPHHTRSQAAPLSIEVAASLQIHRDRKIKGVRWLGNTPRLVTFSSEPVAAPGSGSMGAVAAAAASAGGGQAGSLHRNIMAITDITTRRTTTFRWAHRSTVSLVCTVLPFLAACCEAARDTAPALLTSARRLAPEPTSWAMTHCRLDSKPGSQLESSWTLV